MKYSIYSIRDMKTDQFSNPMCLVNDGHAIRTLSDEMGKEGVMFGTHPEDFELFRLGTFDTDTGLYETHTPRSVVLLSELVKK